MNIPGNRRTWLVAALATAGVVTALGIGAQAVPAAAVDDSLSGVVTSPQGRPIGGVLVAAKRTPGTVTTSVFTDEAGRFAFPRTHVGVGSFDLSIRALGYDLAPVKPTRVSASGTTRVALRLVPANDVTGQYTSNEWIASAPPSGGAVDRRFYLNMCTHCHTVERVFKTGSTATEMNAILLQMATYAVGSTPEHPQLLPPTDAQTLGEISLSRKASPDTIALANYIASVNLSATGKTPFTIKPLPRPSGAATQVTMTTYALPRSEAMPHDVIVDAAGLAWYSDFGHEVLGRLDPATGRTVEYKIPRLKPASPMGSLDIELDRDGKIWIAMLYQGAIARFDPVTAKFKLFPAPAPINNTAVQLAMVAPDHLKVDNKVWVNDSGRAWIHRVDVVTGTYETIKPFAGMAKPVGTGAPHLVYGIGTDAANNLYFADWGDSAIGRIDAKTLKVEFFQVPTPLSRPRRVHMDDQGGFWFAEWQGGKVGRFDTKTHAFREFPLPNRTSAPYDVVPDRNGYIWTGGMSTDRIDRINPANGAVTEYLLPTTTNVRRVFVAPTRTGTAFWVGDNNGATITRIEPHDGM